MSSTSSAETDLGPSGIVLARLRDAFWTFDSSVDTFIGAVTLLVTGFTSEGGRRPTLAATLGTITPFSALVRSVFYCVRAVEGRLRPNEVPGLYGVVLADAGFVRLG